MISYSLRQQVSINRLTIYGDQARGPARKNRVGEKTEEGYELTDCVGLYAGSNPSPVYRAYRDGFDWALFISRKRKGRRVHVPVPFDHLITAERCPAFVCWYAALQRCYSPANPSYVYYGGKGVRVARAWLPNGVSTAGGPVESRLAAFAHFEDWARLHTGRLFVKPGSQLSRYGDVGNYCDGNVEILSSERHAEVTREHRQRLKADPFRGWAYRHRGELRKAIALWNEGHFTVGTIAFSLPSCPSEAQLDYALRHHGGVMLKRSLND